MGLLYQETATVCLEIHVKNHQACQMTFSCTHICLIKVCASPSLLEAMLREQVYREESAKALTQVATGLKSSRVRARVGIFSCTEQLN